MEFQAFRPFVPPQAFVSDVISQPYDVMSVTEARLMAREPRSFLRVTRSEVGLDPHVDVYAAEVYAAARAVLDQLIGDGVLVQEAAPCFGVYRQTRGAHAQIGVVGLASVADYRAGIVQRHELTRAEKEDDRTRHIDATRAQTGPVFLAVRGQPALSELLTTVTLAPPDREAWLDGGVRHEAWLIPQHSERGEALQALLAAEPRATIADGHHRAASAGRVATLMHERGHGAGPWDGFLAVVFPAEMLEIMPYHRVIEDLSACGTSPAALRERLVAALGLQLAPGRPVLARHEVGVFLEERWWTLCFREVIEADPVASLDVALLAERVLAPYLGIDDPRRDRRIDFVGGVRGLGALEARAGAAGVAFQMAPTTMDELLKVADASLIMPPKSTWFEPKLADGLFVQRW